MPIKFRQSIMIVDEKGVPILVPAEEASEVQKAMAIGGVDSNGNLKFFNINWRGALHTEEVNAQLLNKIVKELKKIETHLSYITELAIENEDLEV